MGFYISFSIASRVNNSWIVLHIFHPRKFLFFYTEYQKKNLFPFFSLSVELIKNLNKFSLSKFLQKKISLKLSQTSRHAKKMKKSWFFSSTNSNTAFDRSEISLNLLSSDGFLRFSFIHKWCDDELHHFHSFTCWFIYETSERNSNFNENDSVKFCEILSPVEQLSP